MANFPYFNGTAVPYNVGPRFDLCRRFTDTNVYGTGSVKIWKTRQKVIAGVRIFFNSVCG